MIIFKTKKIIDGTGHASFEGWMGVDKDKIVHVSAMAAGRSSGDTPVVDLGEMTLLPGLIDAHSHVGLVGIGMMPTMSPAEVAAEVFINVELALQEGFTTLRDLGGVDGGIVEVVRRGLVGGPRILPSGPIISQTGGHGDWGHSYSPHAWEGSVPGLVQPAAVVDGVDSVRRAGRQALKDGASQLKVAITGGFSSELDHVGDVQFALDELKALVSVASAKHTYVTAHAHHGEGIRLGLEAGIRCFEHGTFVDKETIAMMASSGARLVSTLSVVRQYEDPDQVQGLRPELRSSAASAFRSMAATLEAAREAGIVVGSGSDIVGTRQRGRGREVAVRALVTSGLEAISAATSANAVILGKSDEIGELREGLLADFIVVDGAPDQSASLLTESRHIRLVVREGVVYKNTLPRVAAAGVARAMPLFSAQG